MVRYYGYYSNVYRGQRKKANEDGLVPSILQPDESSKGYRKNWARLIQGINKYMSKDSFRIAYKRIPIKGFVGFLLLIKLPLYEGGYLGLNYFRAMNRTFTYFIPVFLRIFNYFFSNFRK